MEETTNNTNIEQGQTTETGTEIWKAIREYEGLYEISSFGNVKCLPRLKINGTGGTFFTKEKIKTPRVKSDGYYYTFLTKNGKKKYFSIHRLVAQAFIPNENNLPEVDHINNIRNDNRVENLRWCTRKENIQHTVECDNNTFKHL